MGSHSKHRKIALIIDEEILEELGYFCAGELASLERISREDSGRDLSDKEQMQYQFFHMGKYSLFKRLERILQSVFEQLDSPRVRVYKEGLEVDRR